MKLIYLVIASLLCNFSLSQTGPGGIGSNTNNLFWLDANSLGLSNGNSVNTWTDQSGNASHAIQNSASLKPILRTNESNGFPAIDFDGVNDFMRSNAIPGFNNDASISYFFVMKTDVLAISANPFTNAYTGSSAQNRLHGIVSGATGNLFAFTRDGAGNILQGTLTNSLSYSIHDFIISGTGINSFTNSNSTGSTAAATLTPSTHGYFQIGRRPFLNDLPFDGKIAEVIAYNDALTATQRIIIENYLSSKYGIAINGANDHYAMEGSGHYFNVAGIGMEGGNSVTDATGRSLVNINTPSDLANGDYLLWGHNNASLTVNNTNVPAQFSLFGGTRLNRTWRVDETGDVGTYNLTVDMSGMPALGSSTADYVLLIDDDGDFSNGGTIYHTTGFSFAANQASWTGVDILDGSYFTVAYVPAIFSVTTGGWTDNNTWNCVCQPTSTNNVIISTNDVVTVDGFSEAANLSIVANATLDFSGLNELALTGDFDNQGTFVGLNGHTTFNGTSSQLINSNSAITFEELELDNANGAIIQTGTYSISSSGTFFPTEGNLDVSSVSFTFESDATGSARIDEFTATSSLTGNVVFQRFISAGIGGYRDIAIPILGGSAITNFDDDLFISGLNNFADGCAFVGNTCFSSFKRFVGNTYTDYTNALTVVPRATRGIHAWIADGFPNTLAAPVTIDLTGTVGGFGNVTANATGANTFTLIGNPYFSQIDFDELGLSNIGDFYYVWDVNINNYNWYQIANGASPLTEVIASGQGFVVMPEAASGTVTFTQSAKTSSPAVFIRNATNNDFFRLALSNPNNKYAGDVTFNVSEEADNKFDRFDVPTPYGLDTDAVYISAKVDERIVRCFGMNNREQTLSVPIMINVPDKGYYTLDSRNLELFDKYTCVVLEDLETGSRYDLRNTSQVRFFMEKTKNEEARFILHFSNDACSQFVAGIDINTDDASVEINNFNDYVKVDMNFASQENVSISFFNMLGQNVLTEQHQNVNEKSVKINVPENLKNGVYLIVVETDKKRYTRKYNF